MVVDLVVGVCARLIGTVVNAPAFFSPDGGAGDQGGGPEHVLHLPARTVVKKLVQRVGGPEVEHGCGFCEV